MFGYVLTNPKKLSKEGKDRYRKYYCGLCHQLNLRFGSVGRDTLTYDMTFLTVLMSSLYQLEESEESCRCIHHPIKSNPYIETSVSAFAADMNILLAYFQRLDDWHDDRNLVARKKGAQLEGYLPDIKDRNPRQYMAITDGLEQLGEMEKANELNPDLPANCFGKLMGELFVWRQDDYTNTLRFMGEALGRFIYLLDAVNDLKADIKKQRYNPLVSQMDTDFTPILTIIMAECTAEFEKLPISQDKDILQNVLYSGVWQKYRVRKRKGEDV